MRSGLNTIMLKLAWIIGPGACPFAATALADGMAQQTVNSVIDEDPLPSVRAQGMGGALATVADNVDAAFQNPAGIGGLGPVKDDAPWVRKLYFPAISAAANSNATSLVSDLRKNGASSDAVVGKAAVDSRANLRQYGRVNIAAGIVMKRVMVIPFSDTQIAAVPRGEGSNILDTHYRSVSGIGYGFSVQDPSRRMSLGYFGYNAARKEVLGPLAYDQLIDSGRRNAAVAGYSADYLGHGDNAGLIWRLGNSGAPTLGVTTKNIGGTRFKGRGGASDLIIRQQSSVGFSLSPRFASSGTANFAAKIDQLENKSLPLNQKYSLGAEMLLGGIGSFATFGARAGYNYAGPSAGINLNLGLISCEASTYAVDLAATSTVRVTEQRLSATVYINVAEF